MPATPFDSAIYRDLFLDAEVGSLFTDSAEVRAMLLVEGALAKVQGALGLIPEISSQAIQRASHEVLIDPSGLAAGAGQNAVVVPALLAAFREAMQAPEHAQYVHWGATSQDIMETALVLRLRQVLAFYDKRLVSLVKALGSLAARQAELPMVARTYGQAATATSFGALVAAWGRPLLRHRVRLGPVRDDLLCVSLSGAAGTLSAMGDSGPSVRAGLAKALKLSDPGSSWHSERDRITALAGWITGTAATLGKMGEDLLLLTQSGEVALRQSGGSSTMPQKSNPVLPSVLVALARQIAALNTAIQGAGSHRQQRDGAAWMTEWLTLPQMCLGLARSLSAAEDITSGLVPVSAKMQAGIDAEQGLICAEALSFALAAHMPRPAAQAAVKELCAVVRDTATPLAELASKKWPDLDLSTVFNAQSQLGAAPAEARAFSAETARV